MSGEHTNATPKASSLIDLAGNKRADNTKDDQNQNIQEGLDVKEKPKVEESSNSYHFWLPETNIHLKLRNFI